jgi:putative oxidoreductase
MDTLNPRQRIAEFITFSSTSTARLLSVLRIAAALLLIEHRGEKHFGFPLDTSAKLFASGTLPLLKWMARVLESFGGLHLIFGLFTHPDSFLAIR